MDSVEEKVIRLEERLESHVRGTNEKMEEMGDKLKEYSELNQNVVLLNQTVAQLSESMKEFSHTMTKLNDKVDRGDKEELENQVKKFDRIKTKILDLIIGGVVGAILIKAGLS